MNLLLLSMAYKHLFTLLVHLMAALSQQSLALAQIMWH